MRYDRERKKINDGDLDVLIDLYVNKGWKKSHIAVKLLLNRGLVQYYVKKLRLKRVIPEVRHIPEEIKHLFSKEFKATSYYENVYRPQFNREKEELRKTCTHSKFIIRCSCGCKKVLGSEMTHKLVAI